MQDKKTASGVSRRSANRKGKKVSKKTAKQPARKASKTTARQSAQTNSERSAQADTSEKNRKQTTSKKDKRPILVPLDFSVHSQAALEYAAHLADRLQAPLTVLHVVHDPGEAPGYYRVKGRKAQLRRLEDVADEMLNDFMTKMTERNPEQSSIKKAKRVLVTGLPVTRILEVANKIEPQMVVMGSAGRTAISRFLLGSKAEHVLRICPFPVTIVKAPDNNE